MKRTELESGRTEKDRRAARVTRARYSRIAPFYDLMELLPERMYHPWREHFWNLIGDQFESEDRLLEVGVGTGKNMPFWPQGAAITAIDLTPGMIQRARKRAKRLKLTIELLESDVQELQFPGNHFAMAVATFVFCSVPDPVLGLKELSRVVRPGGSIFLLDHVRSANESLGKVMDFFNPLVLRLMGPNINRDTVGNVERAGLVLENVEDLGRSGIFKLIHAKVPLYD
jgi:phosphatidylethanolamine/phosphatidyl-N-methylethanolamine N-methyltransferase